MAIPTAERLRTRGVKINGECQRCCLEDKSINHMLFECPYSEAVWRCSNIQIFNNPSSDLEDNVRTLLNIMNTSAVPSHLQLLLLPLWVTWIIWKSRNGFLFNKRNVHPNEDAKRAHQATT